MSVVINTSEGNFYAHNWRQLFSNIAKQQGSYTDVYDWIDKANQYLEAFNGTIKTSSEGNGWDITFESEEDAVMFKLSL